MIACTVTSPQYLPHARVMTATLLEHNPEANVVLAYLGPLAGPPDRRAAELGLDPRIEVLTPDEVGEEPAEIRRMGLMYSTQGLAGALKTRLLRHLVRRENDAVLLIDSDICVYGPLDDLADRAAACGALLTTHVSRPLVQSERPMLLAGVFNSGFVGVGPRGLPLLEWWCERTARDSIFSPAAGIVWEQSWLALAPAFFEHEVLRDPGVNTMARELLDRDVEWRDDRPFVSDHPLRCYHFSGPYDPREPDYLLAPTGAPGDVVMRPSGDRRARLSWLSLERRPGARRMSHEYASRLLAAGFGEEQPAALYSELGPDQPLHRAMRRAYRSAVIRAEDAGGELPPNPFDGASVSVFLRWLAEPPDAGSRRDGLTRFALGGHEAYEGAPAVFRRVPGHDSQAFRAWLARRLRSERAQLPDELLPMSPADHPRRPGRRSARGLAARLRPKAEEEGDGRRGPGG